MNMRAATFKPRTLARCVFATAVGLSLGQSPGCAQAAGLSADSDILGIKLTMSRDQAKKIVADSFPGARIIELSAQIGTPAYKKSTTLGFIADITSAPNQANNQRQAQQADAEFRAKQNAGWGNSPLNQSVVNPGDYGRDAVAVIYDPSDSGSGIFSISRVKTFAKSEFIPPKALLDTFDRKYGAPSRVNDKSITWTAPGVLQHAPSSAKWCYLDFGGSFLYEHVDERIFDGRFANTIISQVNEQFVRVLSNLKNYDRSHCGTVLQLMLTLSDDRAYAVGMSETLIDLTRGYAELKAFADDFWAHANAARQDQLQKASQNKPRL